VAEQIPKPAPTPATLSSPPSPPKSELISNHIPLIISIFIRTHPCFVLIISSAYSMYAWQFILGSLLPMYAWQFISMYAWQFIPKINTDGGCGAGHIGSLVRGSCVPTVDYAAKL
jgi:hypothetical protein